MRLHRWRADFSRDSHTCAMCGVSVNAIEQFRAMGGWFRRRDYCASIEALETVAGPCVIVHYIPPTEAAA